MTPNEVLLKAADLIDQRGLWQGQPFDGGGTCASNAIGEVSREFKDKGGSGLSDRARMQLWRYLKYKNLTTANDVTLSIFNWNDDAGSKAEVVNVMRKAANEHD